MKIDQFEDILAWQKAKTLTLEIYKLFYTVRDFGFRDQITRATVSIMNNIAEGFERQSDKEFSHFLFIAKGSCGEVRSMLDLSIDLGYLDRNTGDSLKAQITEISRMLSGLIKTLK